MVPQRLKLPAVAAVLLAAGGSSRMGRPKLLLPLAGTPIVRRVAEALCAAGLDQVVVVVGAGAEQVAEALAGLPLEVHRNEWWAGGISGSIRVGIGALRPQTGAALMVLADQPALTARLIWELVARYRATGARIVAPACRGRRGNPVLFDRTLFPELLAVEADEGARAFLDRYRNETELVEVDDPRLLADVDTIEDYEALRTAIG